MDGGGPELVSDGAIHQDKYEATGIDTCDITHEILAAWFTSAWTKIDGRIFPSPVFIGAHNRDALLTFEPERNAAQLTFGQKLNEIEKAYVFLSTLR